MKGYSKIKSIPSSPSHHSRSMEPNPNPDQWVSFEDHTNPNSPPESQDSGNNEGRRKIKNREISKNQEDEMKEGVFSSSSNPKLKRNTSVSSGSAATLHYSAVKKAFSMRRSSSVADRYCRIHDQASTLPSPTHHNLADDFENISTSIKKKNKRGRILKACKKLIGM